MENYVFVDALTGDEVTFDAQTGEATMRRGSACGGGAGRAEGTEGAEGAGACTSIFFPGCSLINYAMPLVSAVNDTLVQQGVVDGISLLCCGKILSYEPDGPSLRATFEQQLRDRLVQTSIVRIVAACPNCVKALREALAADERTASIEVAVLPQVLANLGCRVDRDVAACLVTGEASAPVVLCAHDSCPDRDAGEFADGLRGLMPEGLLVDPEHHRARSLCCGSLPRAAGKFEAADKLAQRNGQEALDAKADAIAAACMSCVFQLNMAQSSVQALHVLELLYDWRVDWRSVGAWMKLRFLFDETLGVVEVDESSGRAFAGLGGNE